MRVIPAIVFAALTALAYQNCSPSLKGETPGGAESKSEEIIGNGADYTNLIYDPYLENSFGSLPNAKKLEIDTQTGAMRLTDHANGAAKSCTVDRDRLDKLRDVLNRAQICKPGPLPENTAVCMALALADIELSNANAKIQLRPLMCHNGTFLCDGLDEVLRALLGELRDNPPVSCQ